MIKTIIALCSTVAMLANAYGTPKLPKYGTEAWNKLPGASDVILNAQKGDVFAKYLLASVAESEGKTFLIKELFRDPRNYDILKNDELMFKALQKYAEKGFYHAQDMLAGKYYTMQMTDISMALWKKAADQGCPVSQYNLGLVTYNQQKDKEKIPPETIRLWQAAADQEYVPALKDMGIFWMTGVFNGKPDFNKAIFYFEKAARQKHVQAMFLLGEIYEKGLNGKVDKDLAIKYYKAVADTHPYWKEQAEGNGREAMNSSKNNNTTAK